jgi:hypothetical protein
MEDNIEQLYDSSVPEHITRYEFDFDKIKTIDDVIRIIKGLQISFTDKYPEFEEIKDLLKIKE